MGSVVPAERLGIHAVMSGGKNQEQTIPVHMEN